MTIDRPTDEELPHFLYHYTDAAGLLGIIGGAELWATHLQHVNDTYEYRYVFDYAADYLERINSVRALAESRPELARVLERTLRSHALSQPNPRPIDRFVVSFSEVGEDLSQWRAYGDAGSGYSIGFDPHELARFASAAGWSLKRVRYGETENFSTVVQILTDAFADDALELDAAARLAARRISDLAPVTKHEAFAAEREWRLISPPTSVPHAGGGMEFRPGTTSLVPYLRFPNRALDPNTCSEAAFRESIRHVGLGPGLEQELASTALLGLLSRYGINIGVGLSGIPLRRR